MCLHLKDIAIITYFIHLVNTLTGSFCLMIY